MEELFSLHLAVDKRLANHVSMNSAEEDAVDVYEVNKEKLQTLPDFLLRHAEEHHVHTWSGDLVR